MAKHTLKILRCETPQDLKYVWPFYNIMYERVKLKNKFQNNKKTFLTLCSKSVNVLYYKHSIALITFHMNQLTFYTRK